ncbi:MAG: porin [Ferruginibacter sp.]
MRKIFVLLLLFSFNKKTEAQFLMDMLDTTKEAGKGLLGIYKKFDHVRIGGYIQPQFQVAQAEGAKSFEGGDFGTHVSNRFMLRRSRIRIDYVHLKSKGNEPGVQIVFQFDANERSFTVRDVWGRIFENNLELFSFTMGMFARPFGFEANLSSSDRETPERGRMSQTLIKSERDLGAMVSFDVRKEKHPLKMIKIDAGFFNGQGINVTGEFDNKKDFISRISLKPLPINQKLSLSAGISILKGGLLQNTKYVYSTVSSNNEKKVMIDSAASNEGHYSPRNYKGADLQLKFKNKTGFTEIRGEYITGTQTGTATSSETPSALVSGRDGFYRRNFNGAYFYFLQHLFSLRHQLAIKYDWYDPNTKVKGREIGVAGSNFTAADIKYSTLNIGYNYMVSPMAKLSLFYAIVKNENTALSGYTSNVRDNVFTTRIQFRF